MVAKSGGEKRPKGKRKARRGRRWLLGLGLDGADGHVRLTRGRNFRLIGGSQETHERMQEVAIKLDEKLSSRGKQLQDVTRQEFKDLAREVGLREMDP